LKRYLAIIDPHPFPHSSCILIDNQQEHDDGQFCNSNFVAAPMDENKSEDIQNAQAEVPTSQTAPAVSQRMYKCERHNCQAVFLSLVNSNRHKQVHGKNPKLKMVCMLPLHIAASCSLYLRACF